MNTIPAEIDRTLPAGTVHPARAAAEPAFGEERPDSGHRDERHLPRKADLDRAEAPLARGVEKALERPDQRSQLDAFLASQVSLKRPRRSRRRPVRGR